MPDLPFNTFLSSIDQLRDAFETEHLVVFDAETGGLDPKRTFIVGAGFYFPESNQAFYINVGHNLVSDHIPRYPLSELRNCLSPWISNPNNHLIAHNAVFEIRLLYNMGLQPECTISCSATWMHRAYENYRTNCREPSTHPHLKFVNYGLKELIIGLTGELPPSLFEVTNGKTADSAPVHIIAQYCLADCSNSWTIYSLAHETISTDTTLLELVQTLDDPCNHIIAKMMWNGILIDSEEASRQKIFYEEIIYNCKDRIREITHKFDPLNTPRDTIRFLRKYPTIELDYEEQFWHHSHEDTGYGYRKDVLEDWYINQTDPILQEVLALLLSIMTSKQRISSFLSALPPLTKEDGRLYFDRFDSRLFTTRFSCKPNVQNLPKRADKIEDSFWYHILSDKFKGNEKTRNIFIASPGYYLVSFDISSAEPRYLAQACQNALVTKETLMMNEYNSIKNQRRNAWEFLSNQLRYFRNHNPVSPCLPIEWPDLEDDPLYLVYINKAFGGDVYKALLVAALHDEYEIALSKNEVDKWFAENRAKGKLAFLAISYGIKAETLAPQLQWSVQQTEDAINRIYNHYPTLKCLQELTRRQMVFTGKVRCLTGRPRRINGYFELATTLDQVTIQFTRKTAGRYRKYNAQVIILHSGYWTIKVFVVRCELLDEEPNDDGEIGTRIILEANPNTCAIIQIDTTNTFINENTSKQMFRPPFRTIGYNSIKSVTDNHGYIHYLPRMERGKRQAFNAIGQMTGADHLRWLMIRANQRLQFPSFADCKLVLTIHDSLIYEVPKNRLRSFVNAIYPVLTERPGWSDIDFDFDIEYGERYGELASYPIPISFLARVYACVRALLRTLGEILIRAYQWLRTLLDGTVKSRAMLP